MEDRNKDLWKAICDEHETLAETSSEGAPMLELFKLNYVDTGNPLNDFKILVSKIDKIGQDCARNGVVLDDKIKLAKLQDALGKIKKFDDLQVLSVLEGAKTYSDFVTKIKQGSGVQSRISKGRSSSQADQKKQHQENEQPVVPALQCKFLEQLGASDDPSAKAFSFYIKRFKGKGK